MWNKSWRKTQIDLSCFLKILLLSQFINKRLLLNLDVFQSLTDGKGSYSFRQQLNQKEDLLQAALEAKVGATINGQLVGRLCFPIFGEDQEEVTNRDV